MTRLTPRTLIAAALLGFTILPGSAGMAFVASPAAAAPLAEQRFGPWRLQPYDGGLPTKCLAINVATDGNAIFGAGVGPLGAITFILTDPRFALARGRAVEAEVLVDGRRIALARVEAYDRSAITIEGRELGRNEGAILRAIERGNRLVVQADGVRSTFDLAGTTATMRSLSLCAANGGQLVAEVAAAPAPAPASASTSTAPSAVPSYDTLMSAEEAAEIELEVEGDRQEAGLAGAASPGEAVAPTASAGASASATATADQLAGAMDQFTGSGAPVARFQCQMTGHDVMGLPDITGRGRADEVGFAIRGDGSALVNGTALPPLQTKPGSGASASVETAIYSARAFMQAWMGAPAERAPVMGLSAEQQDAYRYVQGLARGMADQVMGSQERYMVVGVASGMVGFFDLDGAGRTVNQATPLCERVQ